MYVYIILFRFFCFIYYLYIFKFNFVFLLYYNADEGKRGNYGKRILGVSILRFKDISMYHMYINIILIVLLIKKNY